jgi:hypothetical protein
MKARNNLPESTGLVEKNKRLGSGREMGFDEIVAELPKQDLRDICDLISRDNPVATQRMCVPKDSHGLLLV